MKKLVSLFAALLWIVSAPTVGATSPKITIGFTATSAYAGLMVAQDKGLFRKHGLDTALLLIALNSNIPAALVSGSIQIGGPTPPVLFQANDGGLDLVIVAGCSVNDTSNHRLGLVGRTGTMKTAQDLVDRKVGVPGLGAYMHVMFRQWLIDNGVDYRKVTFVETPFPQQGDILKAGTVDAVVTADPFFSRITNANPGYPVITFLAEMPAGISEILYATTREWAKDNPGAVQSFYDSIKEADEWVAGNPEETRSIIGKFIKLPPEVLASISLPKSQAEVTDEQLRYWGKVMADQEMIARQPETEKMVVR
jgi:NitT/TauT family transport system substrate-binding protein